jgi:hypothetical protein
VYQQARCACLFSRYDGPLCYKQREDDILLFCVLGRRHVEMALGEANHAPSTSDALSTTPCTLLKVIDVQRLPSCPSVVRVPATNDPESSSKFAEMTGLDSKVCCASWLFVGLPPLTATSVFSCRPVYLERES